LLELKCMWRNIKLCKSSYVSVFRVLLVVGHVVFARSLTIEIIVISVRVSENIG